MSVLLRLLHPRLRLSRQPLLLLRGLLRPLDLVPGRQLPALCRILPARPSAWASPHELQSDGAHGLAGLRVMPGVHRELCRTQHGRVPTHLTLDLAGGVGRALQLLTQIRSRARGWGTHSRFYYQKFYVEP